MNRDEIDREKERLVEGFRKLITGGNKNKFVLEQACYYFPLFLRDVRDIESFGRVEDSTVGAEEVMAAYESCLESARDRLDYARWIGRKEVSRFLRRIEWENRKIEYSFRMMIHKSFPEEIAAVAKTNLENFLNECEKIACFRRTGNLREYDRESSKTIDSYHHKVKELRRKKYELTEGDK